MLPDEEYIKYGSQALADRIISPTASTAPVTITQSIHDHISQYRKEASNIGG
jgi:hypothetical protein